MSDLSNRRGAGLDRYDVAELRYAMTKPTQEQLSHIQALLEKKTGWKNVQIQAVHDESIEGGFIVKCGNFEFDWSDSGRSHFSRFEIHSDQVGSIQLGSRE